ncbi:T9SS type A sorting domain-containing protein [Rufibacter sp. LB8]|uniref:T9SS type A sorting domain-containing protein n=1 Tax=Rufibacter sp. LB8 TaxID=2777781 RepID=UPI00178C82BD|nr:T9SS type A sorting domain-containing protein [Rufibacter sp. LB8]
MSSAIFTVKNTIFAVFISLLTTLSFTASAQTTSLGCKLTSECFDITYTSFVKNSNNTVTLHFSVKTNCGNALSNVAFQLPAGAKATNPKNTNTRFTFSQENGTNNPFYALKFEAINAEGFKNGAVDNFSYTLTAAQFAQLTTIKVQAKASTTVGVVSFKAQTCEPAPLVISGPVLVQAKSQATYSVISGKESANYRWTVPAGWEIVRGQGTKSVTLLASEQPGEVKVEENGQTRAGAMMVESYSLPPATLPVTFTSFTATAQENQVKLAWATASEKDNKEFVLERSQDAKNYNAVGTVAGNGTKTTPTAYATADANAPAGLVYYRLKQVDFNGDYEYSKVISVKALGKKASTLAVSNVYPNPFQQELTIKVELSADAQVTVSFLNLAGQEVFTQKVKATAGTNTSQINGLDTLTNGIYFLKISAGNQTSVQRVVKN